MNIINVPFSLVTITELPAATRIALRLADRKTAAAVLGHELPEQIGTRVVAGVQSILCVGPDEWVVEAPGANRAALTATLANLATALPLSAVEISDREITLALEGPAVLDLLATGCPLDLARLSIGAGTRTVFDTAQVALTREAKDRFHLTVWRSFAPHVRALLDIAVRELAAGL